MNPVSPARSLPDPPMVGRYELHEEIGQGTSGVVYLARDPLIDRWVAIKMLTAEGELGDGGVAAVRGRLLNEAQSAGLLSHSGIVAIYDVVEHVDGRLAIASEYVAGTDLASRLADPDPLPLEFVSAVVSEVAGALDYAHQRGVVHRDLKPANILLGEDGSIKVTDFGIAALRDRDLADELKNLGSPNYLAPERLLGGEAEAASDIYALGVVLYEMLTRNPPFSGDSIAELARNIVQEKPAPIDHYRPDVYPEIRRLIARVLAKEPGDRYETAGQMARDLERALERRALHNDTVPTPLIEELALSEPDPAETPAPSATSPSRIAPVEERSEEEAKPNGTPRVPSVEQPPAGLPAVEPSGMGRKRRWALVTLPVLLGLGLAAVIFLANRLVPPPTPPVAGKAVPQTDPEQLEYLRLLAESRRLFAAGEREEAQRLLDQAERLSPAASRIRQLREIARQQADSERRALAEAEVLDLLDEARIEVERGRLRAAAGLVGRALEIRPDSEEGVRLGDYIARLSSQRLAQERARQEAVPEVVEEPTPAKGYEPFTPASQRTAPASVPVGTGELRIDFYSRRPRGVLTVYADAEQILNRPFRFFEKKKMLRRKGVAGGFDARSEVNAGQLELRIYLTLPEAETQLETVTGVLPAGSLRTLRVRVDDNGVLETQLH